MLRLPILALLLAWAVPGVRAESDLRWAGAAEQGVFTAGAGAASLTTGDPSAQLHVSLGPGDAVGAWFKSFPTVLAAGSFDAVEIGLQVDLPERVGRLPAAVELKGAAGLQRVPLSLRPGGNQLRFPVDWRQCGTLHEIVFVLQHPGGAASWSGTVRVEGRLVHEPDWQRRLAQPGVAVAALAALAALLCLPLPLCALVTARGLVKDVARGLAALLVVAALLITQAPPLSAVGAPGLWRLVAALAGGLAAALVSWAATPDRPRVAEQFRNTVLPGLLLLAASDTPIWALTAGWSDLLRLNATGAALLFVLYHVVHAFQSITARRGIPAAAAWTITLLPFATGLLLALPQHDLMRQVTAGGPVWLGRAVTLTALNVLAALACGGLAGRPGIGGPRGFQALATVGVAVALAPRLADAGAGAWSIVLPLQPLAALVGTALSQGALWAEVFLVTGLLLDALGGQAPTASALRQHARTGFRRAVIFGSVLMGLVQLVAHVPALIPAPPLFVLLVGGALLMPLGKTIVESFDGSAPFVQRLLRHYRDRILLVRGALGAVLVAFAVAAEFRALPTPERAGWGFAAGVLVYAGVSLLRDLRLTLGGHGRVQGLRLYGCEALLGGCAGAALGFYFDTAQVPLVLAKLGQYASYAHAPTPYEIYPLFSKWGFLRLGEYTGGARLLFNEALAGVLSWGLAAWLFALNRSFLQAALDRDRGPLRRLFSRGGLQELGAGTLHVLRWGLWMAPVIFTFLRPVGDPTWYNQDGAVRTVFATVQALRLDESSFTQWSQHVFLWVLASDAFRLLIWLDHMGLRVATLVNLSFNGMDRLDERLARFVGPRYATARLIPEAVKRMATWAPLLLPFYLPTGAAWDEVWREAEALQRLRRGWVEIFWDRPPEARWLAAAALGLFFLGVAALLRRSARRRRALNPPPERLAHRAYTVELHADGEVRSQLRGKGYDLTRRSYEGRDPAGRALFLAEEGGAFWPVAGNFPRPAGTVTLNGQRDALWLERIEGDLTVRVRIVLPVADQPVEQWTVTVENRSDRPRRVRVVPYLEWQLNTAAADRSHTQYNRLFPEVGYEPEAHAVLALHRYTKWIGFLASDTAPDGQLTNRVEFLGRGGTLWNPQALRHGGFRAPVAEKPCPTFDAIAALSIPVEIPPARTATVRLLMGGAATRVQARMLIHRLLPTLSGVPTADPRPARIGHGAPPPGVTPPYCEYRDEGRTLRVLTPYTPRPFDHTLANAGGHVVAVTSRGLHTSSNGNSQQNRLTPDWADTVGRALPAEAFYLYDEAAAAWFSPTFEPLRDPAARHTVDFGADGTAVFHMEQDGLATELTVFVPPDQPAGVYRLVVHNRSDRPRVLRCAPYFQLALADQPEHAAGLRLQRTPEQDLVWFENPRNTFRAGPAFAAVWPPGAAVCTDREHFFGPGRPVERPQWVEQPGASAPPPAARPGAPVAAFLINLALPPGGERTVVAVLGQADTRAAALQARDALCSEAGAQQALAATRAGWRARLATLQVRSSDPAFDQLLPWLAYQALAERLWARRGFYQASGAFGFRDQLQDAVNLAWVDPTLARAQILLHAAQQFEEGDAVHWFFRLADGRTGFASRSHAYDNLLWLGWAVVEYVRMTGDESVLDERVPYLRGDLPFPPLPEGKHGLGFFPHRSPVADRVLDHVLRAADLVLRRRLGAHGLPLIGTGDWNDGLDEIGSAGKGESTWLGFFLYYILDRLLPLIAQRKGRRAARRYGLRLAALKEALEDTWRGDRYLRAYHDDGTEIGVKGSGIWEIDALTAAWAVFSGLNPQRGRRVFDTAVHVLERGPVIQLGWPPLREDSRPYLGRSSRYPEGVRENGMYSHGVQWLVRAARLLAQQRAEVGDEAAAAHYRATAWRLWRKISPLDHVEGDRLEVFGGQPNKQPADYLTTFEPGRMIWHGYTGAAAWMLREALEGVVGAELAGNRVVLPRDFDQPRGDLQVRSVQRELAPASRPGAQPPA